MEEMPKKKERCCPLRCRLDLKEMGDRLLDLEWVGCCRPFARIELADRSLTGGGLSDSHGRLWRTEIGALAVH
ncbi:hypothetical protein ACLOJK_007811 [Asimina triloba]